MENVPDPDHKIKVNDGIKQGAQKKRPWYKHKLNLPTVVIVLLFGIGLMSGVGIYSLRHKDKKTESITKAVTAGAVPVVPKTKSAPVATDNGAPVPTIENLPHESSGGGNYDVGTVNYVKLTAARTNNLIPKVYAATVTNSRVIVYAHHDGQIFNGVPNGSIYLYDTKSKDNFVIVKAGTASNPLNNFHPILVGSSKMLFYQQKDLSLTTIKVLDLATGAVSDLNAPIKPLNSNKEYNYENVVVSPDGKEVAIAQDGKIVVWNADTNQFTQYPVSLQYYAAGITDSNAPTGYSYKEITWSDDSSKVYYSDKNIFSLPANNGYAQYVNNRILSLDISTGQSSVLVGSDYPKTNLSEYKSKLFFRKRAGTSNTASTSEAYVDLSGQTPSVVDIPNSTNFAFSILPTFDLKNIVATPPYSNSNQLLYMGIDGSNQVNLYDKISTSSNLLKKNYIQPLPIGWQDSETLLFSVNSGAASDIYSYNLRTNVVTLVLESSIN